MKIIVDGDACPAKGIISQVGKKMNIPVLIIVSIAHWQNFSQEVEWMIVDNVSQEVDIAIINKMQKGDLIVTDDYGLASLVLGKGGQAISFRGIVYKKEKMDFLLEQRYLAQKMRKMKKSTKGPKPYIKEDEQRLADNLLFLLSSKEKEN